MADQFSGGPLEPKRQFLTGGHLLQRPANYTIFILSGTHTNYDRVVMVLRDHFHKTPFGTANFIGRLDEEGRVAVATYSHDVAETKLQDIRQSRYGRRLGFDFEVQPPLKPPSGPVLG